MPSNPHLVGGLIRKLLFPISLQVKGTRLPQEYWCCFRLTIIIWLGVIYVYICIDCQSSILSHMVPELINNLICWNCKGCIGKSIGPVQYRFTIPSLLASLLAQRLVAGSIFLSEKKTGKKKTRKKWASYMPLSQLGMPSSSRPIHIMYSFLAFTFVRQLNVT